VQETSEKEHLLYKMSWPEISEATQKIDAVLVPVGSTEQHGRHLPIDFDFFSATRLCEICAKRLNDSGKWVVLAPTISYGCSWYHMKFPGTVTLTQDTFIRVVKEVCRSLSSHGLKNIILFNSHGGNSAALTVALTELYSENRIRVVLAQWFTLGNQVISDLGIKTPRLHAGESETSLAIALGAKIRESELTIACMDRQKIHAERGIPTSKHISYDPVRPGSGVIIPMDFIDDISETGVVGDATLGTLKKGEEIVKGVIEKLCELIQDLSQRQAAS
jgi:creatinine amidohydrolase